MNTSTDRNHVSHDASPSAANIDTHSSRYVVYVIFLLTLVNVFNYMDRMALSVLAPAIKAELNLSDAQLGLLTGVAFAVFYAVCAVPIARWADYGVRKNIIALALAVWSTFTALSGAAQNFFHLFLARVGVGAGEAGGLPPAQSVICDYVPLKRRPLVFAIHTFGLAVGMMLGMALAGMLAERIGWRWTFVALGVPGLLFAVLVQLTLREPQRGAFEAGNYEKNAKPMSQTIAVLSRRRTYRFLLLKLVASGFVVSGLTQWWPSLYVRVYGFDLSSTGMSLGLAIGVGSAIGLLLGGVVSNRLIQRDVRLPLKIGAAAFFFALPTAVGSLIFPSVFGSLLCAFLTALFVSVDSGPTIAALYSVVAANMRATAGALTILFQSVLGSSLGPLSVGVLSDALAPSLGAESLRYALFAPVLFIPVVSFLMLAAAKALPGDLTEKGTRS